MTAGERRLLNEDEDIERLPITRLRTGYEAVISGVADRGDEDSIQPDDAGRMIDLMLFRLPLGISTTASTVAPAPSRAIA
jgi:hypothetical protein